MWTSGYGEAIEGSHNRATREARHSVSFSHKEIIEKAYGYFRSSIIREVRGKYFITHFGLDLRRADGNITFYGAGQKVGANFTILGPIVGFYGTAGSILDSIGVYVDPALWPDRPSRLVMLRAGGKTYGHRNEYTFDHNIELGEPFAIRIADLIIYHGANSINGLRVVYEDHLRNRIPISSGVLNGENVSVTLQRGDYIKALEVDNLSVSSKFVLIDSD